LLITLLDLSDEPSLHGRAMFRFIYPETAYWGPGLASNLPETMPRDAACSTTWLRFGTVVDLDGCGATRGAA
jgi:hypothetical protein